jgi:hypothetical protein
MALKKLEYIMSRRTLSHAMRRIHSVTRVDWFELSGGGGTVFLSGAAPSDTSSLLNEQCGDQGGRHPADAEFVFDNDANTLR